MDARSIDDQAVLLAACPIGRRATGSLSVDGWILADRADRAQPGVALGEDEQLVTQLFQRAEVADAREPWGTPVRNRGAEAGADLAEQPMARGFSTFLQSWPQRTRQMMSSARSRRSSLK